MRYLWDYEQRSPEIMGGNVFFLNIQTITLALEENKLKLCFLCRDNASILCPTLPSGLLLLDKMYSVKLAAQVLIRTQYKCLQLKSEVWLIELTVI